MSSSSHFASSFFSSVQFHCILNPGCLPPAARRVDMMLEIFGNPNEVEIETSSQRAVQTRLLGADRADHIHIHTFHKLEAGYVYQQSPPAFKPTPHIMQALPCGQYRGAYGLEKGLPCGFTPDRNSAHLTACIRQIGAFKSASFGLSHSHYHPERIALVSELEGCADSPGEVPKGDAEEFASSMGAEKASFDLGDVRFGGGDDLTPIALCIRQRTVIGIIVSWSQAFDPAAGKSRDQSYIEVMLCRCDEKIWSAAVPHMQGVQWLRQASVPRCWIDVVPREDEAWREVFVRWR
ncbi:hypothetical protein BU25DRAFT_422645 [Macroventuria anomochaeta]|uniref:Uncharacterized protein n=1 Tax=Macroventuria anomochaeta TaxID=301207 RepID=A0ACB6RWT1_9PLEO|nr:uncharacterized protein BU25DRAFT_422645 [Macroventuria anomochaeta]KAF2626496.1 hypothetical protein BU25DRAFT_422645 [Macroventuria anomochaeta]